MAPNFALYVRVKWKHDSDDDPVWYLSELDEDGYETRKIQIYRDGRSEWADGNHETDSVGLAEIAFPGVDVVNAMPDFDAEEITAAEFGLAWRNAAR
ncbi:DUF6881 domain-containing protein [Amycolatopsis lurida]